MKPIAFRWNSVTMTLFDFSEYICPSQYYLQEYIGRCDNGELFGEQITCVDLLYPIQLGVYDQTTSYFETITLNHDFDTYTHMGALEPGILMSINYPIQAIVEGESPVTIHDNDELRAQIYRIIPICE
ncbi:MAG: hypothetical protein R2793_08490 [Flavobacteriaceae bacterium]